MNRTEEHFYKIAAQEVAEKQFSKGIMAKALVEAAGDEKGTVLSYIRLRVAQLKDEESKRLQLEQAVVFQHESEAKRAAFHRWWRSRISSSPGITFLIFTILLPIGILAAIMAAFKAIQIFVFNSGVQQIATSQTTAALEEMRRNQ